MTDVISEEVIIRFDVCRAERDMEDLFTQIVFVDLIGQPRGTVGIKYCTSAATNSCILQTGKPQIDNVYLILSTNTASKNPE